METQNYEQVVQSLRKTFATNKTRDVSFRKQQLVRLVEGMKANEQEFAKAFKADLGVSHESLNFISQVTAQISQIQYLVDNVEEYAKPRKLDSTLALGRVQSKIVPQPLGAALIMGAWNFPIVTGVLPMAEAIAAGNTACYKPSELAPEVSRTIKKVFDEYLDQDCYKVIEGGTDTIIGLQQQRWDLIIFTGSPQKGKLVAQQAAKNLTPVVLELGGKSPTIVDSDADLSLAAKKLASTKLTNSGQICLTPDYLFVQKSVQEPFIQELKNQFELQYSKDPKNSSDYSRIITQDITKRLEELIKTSGGQVIHGGEVDVQNKYVAPTIILNPKKDSQIMEEEIFGPILPINTYENIQDVIDHINANEKPLALYYYGNNKDHISKLENETSSGSFTTNQSVLHVIDPNFPFGGVGNSGIGSLRGIHGFNSSSALKPVMYGDTYNGKLMDMAYAPFDKKKFQTSSKILPYLVTKKASTLKKGGALGLGLPILGYLISKSFN